MKLRLLALGAFLICLTSCFDVIETFNIKEDGSGTYEVKMDMSRSFGLLAMMKQGGNEDGKKKEKIDSIIYTKNITDTSTALTIEEKAALRNSYTKIHMDEDEGEGYINLYYPFANGKELEIIQKAMAKSGTNKTVMGALGNAMGKQVPPATAVEQGNEGTGLPTGDFNYSLTANSLVRKVKPSTKMEEPKTDNEQLPPQLKEMMKINYSTTVNLPRPVKNYTGKGSTLSADKKQVKFNKTMDLDAKLTPADFDFSIDY
jgi:hypothetical protein